MIQMFTWFSSQRHLSDELWRISSFLELLQTREVEEALRRAMNAVRFGKSISRGRLSLHGLWKLEKISKK